MKRNNGTNALYIFLFSIIFGVGIVGILEITIRYYSDVKLFGNSEDLFVANRFFDSYGNNSNGEYISFDEKVYTDSAGFRVPHDGYNYPANPSKRILFLGDSIAFGPGVPETKTFIGKTRTNHPNWLVHNSSVIGYAFYDYLNVARTLTIDNSYDLALLVVCLNDIYDTSSRNIKENVLRDNDRSMAGEKELREKVTDVLRTIDFIIELNEFFRENSKLYIYMKSFITNPAKRYFQADLIEYKSSSVDDFKYLIALWRELSEINIPLAVIVLPYSYQLEVVREIRNDRPDAFDIMIPQLLIKGAFSENEAFVFDPVDFLLTNVSDDLDTLFIRFDPMHFSEAGHQLISRYLEDLLRELEY